MKKLIVPVLSLLIISAGAYSQDAVLTKGETVSYLNKKLKEALAQRFETHYVVEEVLALNDCELTLKKSLANTNNYTPSYRSEGTNSYRRADFEEVFKPEHIKEITDYPGQNSESCGRLKITLIGNTSIAKTFQRAYVPRTSSYNVNHSDPQEYHRTGRWYRTVTENYYIWDIETTKTATTNVVVFFYLKSDPTNFNKIKKALEHLRDLCKAEDDPFGE